MNSRLRRRRWHRKLFAAGIPGIQVDGNDVIAVRHWVERALERGRRGEGACLIEAVTYRLSDHTTADDASRYRKQDEVENAWKVEPLLRMRKYLTDLRVWDDQKEKNPCWRKRRVKSISRCRNT